MPEYLIIETDDGLTVAEVAAGTSPETAAEQAGGVIVDRTLYKTYDDAYDAMLLVQSDAEDEEQHD